MTSGQTLDEFLLGNFTLSLVETEDGKLSINAENEVLSKFYQKLLSPEQISQRTMNLIRTSREFIDDFEESLSGLGTNMRITISDDAILNFDLKLPIGSRIFERSFSIELDEIVMDPMQYCDRYLGQLYVMNQQHSLNESKHEIEKILNQLILYGKQMDQRVKELQIQIDAIEADGRK